MRENLDFHAVQARVGTIEANILMFRFSIFYGLVLFRD